MSNVISKSLNIKCQMYFAKSVDLVRSQYILWYLNYGLLWRNCVDQASASIVFWFSAFFYHLAAFFYHLAAFILSPGSMGTVLWARSPRLPFGPTPVHCKAFSNSLKVGTLFCHPTNRMIFCLQSFHRMKIVVLFVASHASNMTLDLKTSTLYNLFQ